MLGVIQGISEILLGLFVILDRDDLRLLDRSALTEGNLLAIGLFVAALGVVVILLALALGRGSEIVRLLFGAVAAMNVGSSLWATIALHGEQRWAGLYGVVVGLVVLYILYGSERSEEFFATR